MEKPTGTGIGNVHNVSSCAKTSAWNKSNGSHSTKLSTRRDFTKTNLKDAECSCPAWAPNGNEARRFRSALQSIIVADKFIDMPQEIEFLQKKFFTPEARHALYYGFNHSNSFVNMLEASRRKIMDASRTVEPFELAIKAFDAVVSSTIAFRMQKDSPKSEPSQDDSDAQEEFALASLFLPETLIISFCLCAILRSAYLFKDNVRNLPAALFPAFILKTLQLYVSSREMQQFNDDTRTDVAVDCIAQLLPWLRKCQGLILEERALTLSVEESISVQLTKSPYNQRVETLYKCARQFFARQEFDRALEFAQQALSLYERLSLIDCKNVRDADLLALTGLLQLLCGDSTDDNEALGNLSSALDAKLCHARGTTNKSLSIGHLLTVIASKLRKQGAFGLASEVATAMANLSASAASTHGPSVSLLSKQLRDDARRLCFEIDSRPNRHCLRRTRYASCALSDSTFGPGIRIHPDLSNTSFVGATFNGTTGGKLTVCDVHAFLQFAGQNLPKNDCRYTSGDYVLPVFHRAHCEAITQSMSTALYQLNQERNVLPSLLTPVQLPSLAFSRGLGGLKYITRDAWDKQNGPRLSFFEAENSGVPHIFKNMAAPSKHNTVDIYLPFFE